MPLIKIYDRYDRCIFSENLLTLEALSEVIKDFNLAGYTLDLSHQSLDFSQTLAVAKALKGTKLNVNLSNTDLFSEGLILISQALEDSSAYMADFSGNTLGPDGAGHMAKFFSNNDKLSSIKLGRGIFTLKEDVPNGLIAFFENLNSKAIHTLDLSDNQISPEAIAALVEYTKRGPLRNLFLNRVKITRSALKGLAETTLEVLGLSGIIMRTREISSLTQGVILGARLRELYLSHNKIQAMDARILAEALKNSPLEKLELDYNDIKDIGTKALAAALKDSPLKHLRLASNGITNTGAVALADNFQGSQLHTLMLFGNDIGDLGAKRLFKNLSRTLHVLDLFKNERISKRSVRYIVKRLNKTCIRTLGLESKNYKFSCSNIFLIKFLSGTALTRLIVSCALNADLNKVLMKNLEYRRKQIISIARVMITLKFDIELWIQKILPFIEEYGPFMREAEAIFNFVKDRSSTWRFCFTKSEGLKIVPPKPIDSLLEDVSTQEELSNSGCEFS